MGADEEMMCVVCVNMICGRVIYLGKGGTSEPGRISSELLMCGGGVRRILSSPLVARCRETIDVCIWRMVVFMPVVVIVWECLLCSSHCQRRLAS